MPHPDIVVIGAGAAGLMAAIHAAGPGRRVLVLERTKDGGRKILISGGGRCNILPSAWRPEQYVTASSPNTMRNMLRAWPLDEQRAFFERDLRIPLALEPDTGKLFPASNRARDVRDRLVDAARDRGAEFRFDAHVVALDPDSGGWRIRLASGDVVHAPAVVVATGGLSVPATGSDGTGLRLLETLGHTVHPLYPARTPLTATPPGTQGVSGEPITRDVTGEEVYSTLYAIEESPLVEGVVWVGSYDGLFHVTRDGGATWTDVTPPDLPPGGRVQAIHASAHDAGTAYYAVLRWMLDDWAPYVYRTRDYGRTWALLTDGENGIPADYPVRVVREVPVRPGLLYAGSAVSPAVTRGVFVGGALVWLVLLTATALGRDPVLPLVGHAFKRWAEDPPGGQV